MRIRMKFHSYAHAANAIVLNLGEEIEECVDALTKLRLDLLASAFEQVHRNAGVIPVLEFDRRFAYAGYFLGRKQAQTVYQS
jgi:hypothetical protein